MISNKLSHFDKVFGRLFFSKCAFRHSEMIDDAKIGRASSKKRLFFLRGWYVHLFFYWFFQRFLFHILVKPLKMMINAPSLYRRRYHVLLPELSNTVSDWNTDQTKRIDACGSCGNLIWNPFNFQTIQGVDFGGTPKPCDLF